MIDTTIVVRTCFFVIAFVVSSGLLLAGSVQLVRASAFVRIERQPEFRRCLAWALGIGTAFVSVQAYGLDSLIHQETVESAEGLKHAAFARERAGKVLR